jgi:membrane associated rhomboid family serine protease
VLGAYLLLFPRKRVTVIMLRILMPVPAIVAIGVWFLFQLLNGMGALGSQTGGVAYAAHIGGFIAGLLLVKLFDQGPRRRTGHYRMRR